jgi:cytochrome o ubiquinol oxidase subunit 3
MRESTRTDSTLTVHHDSSLHGSTQIPDPHQDAFSRVILGFWTYIMTDCILFATLFTTFAVLHHETFGGPTAKDLFSLKTAFIETMLLLLSSVTCGLGMLSAKNSRVRPIYLWFGLAFLFGASFVFFEVKEFAEFVQAGHSWRQSAFLSSFFTLVGTHGLHVSIGLFWMFILLMQILKKGITVTTFRRMVCFSMFWHFLDLVWIFIFTFVYLMGVA